MKKFIIAVLALALIGLAVTGGVFFMLRTEEIGYSPELVAPVGTSVQIVEETEDSISIKKEADEDFKVLMFTDLHLNGDKENDNIAINYLLSNIHENRPDLVIFAGDNISSAFSKKRTRQFAEIMDRTQVYWCAVLGNHDGEGIFTYSREEIVDIYNSSEYCLMKKGKEDIDGFGNYTINILNSDDSIKEVLFFMDSGDYMTDEIREQYNVPDDASHYDGVKESQVQWYKEKHDELTEKFGDFKSVTVMHIPPYQTGYAEDFDFLYGEKREYTCTAGFDSGIFDALKEKGSTQAVYYGHDHINDFGFMYEGILLSYIQSSGYSSYNMGNSRNAPESEWLQGCTLLKFRTDGTYDAERILNHQ